MHAMYTPLASLPLLMLLLALLLSLGTRLNEAAAVIARDVDATVDKEVAPVGVVKTDLLSLEQEIGGNPAAQRGVRQARSFLLGVGGGPAWFGGGWGFPSYGYYSSPFYGYAGFGGYGVYAGLGDYGGYYPGVFGYKKIIVG